MSEQLKVSSSPHIRSKETTGNIMLWVIIALLPATFFEFTTSVTHMHGCLLL